MLLLINSYFSNMNFLKKLIFFFIFCLFITPAFSQYVEEEDTVQTVDLNVEGNYGNPDEDFFEDELLTDKELIIDSNAIAFMAWVFPNIVEDIPAKNIYPIWDTLHVHPYRFDLAKWNDTIRIALIDPSNGMKYVPPHIGRVNSNFGWRRYRYHYGIDVGLKTGDTIVATWDGMVRVNQLSRSYGNVIVIRHNNGLETVYAHLSKSYVSSGQLVKAGQVIGLGGSTGHSTGPHLHFEIRYLGQPIDPTDVIDFTTFKLKSPQLIISPKSFVYLSTAKATRYHRVRSGDTVGKIAKKYGVSVKYLSRLNGVNSKTKLKTGRLIRYR